MSSCYSTRYLKKINNSTQQITKDIRKELDNIRQTAAKAAKTTKRRKPISRASGTPTLPDTMPPLGSMMTNPDTVSGPELRRSLHNSAWSKTASISEESTLEKDALEDALEAAEFVSNMRGEDYLKYSKDSQPFEQILRVLDDDIGENLEHIERWRDRETDRASEQPRWTKNDERRYRTTITKLLNSNAQRIRDRQRCRTNIRSLRTSLESTRAYVRDDLNLRSAEDVRAFTYVTATFLPIGFATSIFSMGGAPDGDLLRNMIKVAGVALAITAVALIFDKILGSVARAIRNFVLHPWNHIVCFIDYLEDSFMELRLKAMPFSPEDADKSTERDFGVEESTKKAFRWRAVTGLRWRPRKERADTDAEVGSRAQI